MQLDIDLQEFCSGMGHPVTKETPTNYKKVIACEDLRKVRLKGMCKELENVAQSYSDDNQINEAQRQRFLTHDEIVFIQKDTRFIYARKVVDY